MSRTRDITYTPPARLTYTIALYGDEDLALGGVMILGDPVFRTRVDNKLPLDIKGLKFTNKEIVVQ
jgi:hypothetical protein